MIQRRKDKEITDPKTIEEILSKSTICRIAMVDDGEPYIVPLNYGYFDRAIYFHSAPAGRKIEILKKCNRVCFEIEYSSNIIKHDLPCKWTTKYRSLVGYGTIEIMSDIEKKKRGMDIIMAHHGMKENLVYNDRYLNTIFILKLKIESVTGKQSGNWD